MQQDLPHNWALAGLTRGNGDLGRPIDLGEMWVPEDIELDEGGTYLLVNQTPYELDSDVQLDGYGDPIFVPDGTTKKSADVHILDEFRRLSEAPPDRILVFARKWGTLELCEHGLPNTHSSDCTPTAREPIERWRWFARAVGAMLNIAASLHSGEPTRSEDWAALWDSDRKGQMPLDDWWRDLSFSNVEADQVALTREITEWLIIGDIRPRMHWRGKAPSITLSSSDDWFGGTYSSLFSVLSTQLAFAVCGVEGLATCSACGAAYVPEKRTPQSSNRRHYCRECGSRAAWRLSKRDSRKRQAAAVEAGPEKGERL